MPWVMSYRQLVPAWMDIKYQDPRTFVHGAPQQLLEILVTTHQLVMNASTHAKIVLRCI